MFQRRKEVRYQTQSIEAFGVGDNVASCELLKAISRHSRAEAVVVTGAATCVSLSFEKRIFYEFHKT
jgi:hypothetical protein